LSRKLDECNPLIPGTAAGCVPKYFGYGVYIGQLDNFPGLAAALGNPTLGDEVTATHLYVLQQFQAGADFTSELNSRTHS